MPLASPLPDGNAPIEFAAARQARLPWAATSPKVALKVVGLAAVCLLLSAAGGTALATTIDDVALAPPTAASVGAVLSLIETRSLPAEPLIQLATHKRNNGGGGAGGGGGGGGGGSAGSLSLPRVSGMPWSSGSGCHSNGFDKWRGRPSDIYGWWAPRTSWSKLISSISWFQKYASMPGRLSLALPLLTEDTAGRFDLCNSGAFDSQFREIGRRLQSYGLGDSIIRLGWEMNHHSFPWAVPPEKKTEYKACFQRQVNVLHSQAPNLLIEWNPKKGSSYKYDMRDIYPGNAAVDIIGVDYYDGWRTMDNEAEWNWHYNATVNGGPYGIGTWLAFAKSQGKPMSTPEWGTCEGCSDPSQKDNPFYIRKMNEFFRANASSIAYETYFNCSAKYNGASFQLYPSHINPKASAEYKARW